MKTITELKSLAKESIKGKIGLLFEMGLVVFFCQIVVSLIPVVGQFVSHITGVAFTLGFVLVFLRVAKGEPFSFDDAFYGFSDLWTAFKAQFMMGFFIMLWSLLLVIPGIIKGIAYSMTWYILAENKGMPVLEAITRSRKMMDGHKMELFILCLSFIGWYLLVVVTAGIASIWVLPYFHATLANFYLSVKEEYESRNQTVVVD